MKPLPYPMGITLAVFAIILFIWLVNSICRKRIELFWLFLGLLTIVAGIYFAARYSGIIYDYTPGWRVVGYPMAAAFLKLDPSSQAWVDYIKYPPIFVIVLNSVFWLFLPSMVISIPAWLRLYTLKRIRQPKVHS